MTRVPTSDKLFRITLADSEIRLTKLTQSTESPTVVATRPPINAAPLSPRWQIDMVTMS
jgi:hypothetical protein